MSTSGPASTPGNLRFALYTSSRGNYFFHEIRDLIGAGLKELGISVEMRDERAGFSPKTDWHLVIAPHEFFELGAGKDLVAQKWPANLLIFNTEQPSSHWLALSARHFERATAIWDIDFDSSLRICKQGYRCDYLPLGYVENSALLQEVAPLPLIEETRPLSADVRSHSSFRQPFGTRPIDLLFLGHGSPRREKYFAKHAARLRQLNCFFHQPAATRPMIPGQTTNMNTLTSVGLAQRSKILLNIHHGVDRYFEWHRIALLGIAQRTLVITEPCSIAPPFQANLDYVEAPLDELPDRIEHFLGSAAGQAEAQGIIDHGLATLTTRCRLSDSLRPLVETLSAPATKRISTAERYFPVVVNAAPPGSLALCVITPDVAGEGPQADCGSAQVALAEALAQAGHMVTLLHTEPRYGEEFSASHWRKHFSARGIEYLPMPAGTQTRLEATEACNRSYEAYLWLRDQAFAVVHLPDAHGIGFYSLLAKKQGLAFPQTRFCVHAHGPRAWRREASQQFVQNPYELELDFLEQECFRRADALVCSTQSMGTWLEQQKWPLPDDRQFRPNPLPPAAVARPGSTPDPAAPPGAARICELVYFGPLNSCPGLALFCDALDLLGPHGLRNVTVTLADDSTTPKAPRVLEYLYARNRQWTFTWKILSVTSTALADYLRGEGRLIVLPSLRENSPLSLRKCLAHGLPLLAVHGAGVAELIHPADHAQALCAGTASALAFALKNALREGINPARAADQSAATQVWWEWHAAWATKTATTLPDAPACLPLVSVCLIHFNRPEYLAQALASLRAQDYPNFEVVLVDDGSTKPEAIAYLAGLEPEFQVRNWRLIRQENRYLGAARNNAARQANGQYIVFMDDDNFAKPNQLSTFVRVIQNTGAEIVTSAMDLFTGTASPQLNTKPKARWIFLGGAAGTGVFRNCFGDANGCMRRETFLRLGGFTEDYGVTHEDWEFYARATLQGCHVETTPEALFWYRVADQSMIRSTPRFANHQRSLRPYLAAVPAKLQGLVQCLQGSILFPAEKNIPNPGHENLLRLHRRMVAIAKELVSTDQRAASEAVFMEVLQSAESTQHPGIVLLALLDIGNALLEKDRGPLAEQVIERAVKIARAGCDPAAIKEAEDLLAAAKSRRGSGKRPNRQVSSPAPQVKNAGRLAGTDAGPGGPLAPVNAPSVHPAQAHPLVSIIIPVFNKLPLTRACLVSLARSRNTSPAEIIVVDNASSDGTAGFLGTEEAVGHIRVLTHSQNFGFAHACNTGAHAALGSFLLFLNNDTEVTDGWIDALVAAAKQPEVGVVGAKLLYANNTIQHAGIGWINGVPDHIHRHAHPLAPEVNTARELDMVTGACLLIPRALFMQLAGFDEIYRNGVEDIDLCLRARAAGRKVVYEPKAVVYHLEGQSSGRFDHVRENLAIFFQRWGKAFDDQMHFVLPQPARISPSGRSVLLAGRPPTGAAQSLVKGIFTAWEGSFLDFGSLSHVNRELTRALAGSDRVRLQRVNSSAPRKDAALPRELAELASTLANQSAAGTQITLRHQWPPDWSRPRQGMLVIMQPWEFGSLPADWVRQASAVDEFWVNSNYVRQVYISSGVDSAKVKVVPLGIDPTVFRPAVPAYPLPTAKRLKFIFVGGTITRKGPDVLLAAYLANFTAADDVCLVIKDFGGKTVYAGQTLEAQIKAAQVRPGAPEILYLNEELAAEALPALYAACDCLVHPYRGEGFGLPVLEAMACGLPVIVTGGGSTDDFATDEFAYRIPAVRKFIGTSIGGMQLAGEGWLLEPDVIRLGERMKWVASHRDDARALGQRASVHARNYWTWDHAATVAAGRLQAIAAQSVLPPSARIAAVPRKLSASTLPAVARVGDLAEARELLRKKSPRAAWDRARDAIRARPFHPEAFLLLAEIARSVGAAAGARSCAEHAQQLAPALKSVKKFLKGGFHGNTKADWLVLPPEIDYRKAKSRPRLSVCLIVKDEERFIGQCLASIKDLADQIVVVDTGSTDRTADIARKLGAEIHAFAWKDDFSAARNAALQHATGDWVLSLDADEELPPENHAALRRLLEHDPVMGWRLPLIDVGREQDGHSHVPRLFRNAPGLFFVGRVHEQVFYSVEARCREWGLENRVGDATLIHHGYTKELVQERGKVARNLRLLEQAVNEIPDDPALFMNYGLELARSNRTEEGLRHYATAFDLMSARPASAAIPETREALLTQYATFLRAAKHPAEVLSVLSSPLARSSDPTASQHLMLGLAYMDLKQFPAAAQQLRHCLAKRAQPALTPVNPDIRTVLPRHCLAACLWQMKETDDADQEFRAGIAEAPEAEKLHVDYVNFLHERGRTVDALQLLNQFTSAHPAAAAAWKAGGQITLSEPKLLEVAVDWTAVALSHHPADATVLAQRAEALMLAGLLEEALPLWSKIDGDASPRVLAARILCQAALGATLVDPPVTLAAAVSQEFGRWYWQLVEFGAEPTVLQLHATVGSLERVLPDSARLLHSIFEKLAVTEAV